VAPTVFSSKAVNVVLNRGAPLVAEDDSLLRLVLMPRHNHHSLTAPILLRWSKMKRSCVP
jgi:hypothetical protein